MARWAKDLPAMQETQKTLVHSLDGEDPLEGKMATHSSFLPGKSQAILAWKSHGQRSLMGYSPKSHKE